MVKMAVLLGKQLWAQTDGDKGGTLEFEEFLLFYKKFFNVTDLSPGVCPLEEFYRALRPNAMRNTVCVSQIGH